MKNHELLDMIGDVNEDYVLEAGNNVAHPRFRWKTLAACAACAALVLGAYPVYRALNPPLHSYTVLEGGGMATLDDVKAPAGGVDDVPARIPNPDLISTPGGAYVSGDKGETGIDGTEYTVPGQDAPADEAAAMQYGKLLQSMGGVDEMEPAAYPEWFAGAWIDHGGASDTPAWLTVAIVDGFRTPEREAEITGWCGGGVAFQSAKYSHAYLDSLMEPATALLDGTGLNCGIGVDVVANCLGVDLYSDGAAIPDSVLAGLAKLDPDGDAIRVRLFTGRIDTLTDALKSAPEPADSEARATPAVTADNEPTPTPVDDGSPVRRGDEPDAYAPAPGGAQPAGELPQVKEGREASRPAHYDLLPLEE